MRGLSTLRGPVFYQTLPLLECIFRNPGFWIPAFRTICLPFVRQVKPLHWTAFLKPLVVHRVSSILPCRILIQVGLSPLNGRIIYPPHSCICRILGHYNTSITRKSDITSWRTNLPSKNTISKEGAFRTGTWLHTRRRQKNKRKGQKYCLRNTLASTWLMGCRKRKKPTQNWIGFLHGELSLSLLKNGGYLLSHFYAVPSTWLGLTSLFGMGRGGSPTL